MPWSHFTSSGQIKRASIGQAGASGATGVSGTAGAIGLDGLDARGQVGATGAIGLTGVTGATGTAGVFGPDGLDGATGAPGVSGATGTPGTTGLTGATGPAGLDGTDGQAGPTGAGVSGASGSTGPIGLDGSDGQKGATGVSGVAGPSGTAGVGITGATGTEGLAGLDGSKGQTGPAGPSGAQGPQGLDGLDGPGNASISSGVSGLVFGTAADIQDVASVEDAGSGTKVPHANHAHAHGAGFDPDAHHFQNHGAADHDNVTREIALFPESFSFSGESGSFANVGTSPNTFSSATCLDGADAGFRCGLLIPNDWVSGLDLAILWVPSATDASGTAKVSWQRTALFAATGESYSAATSSLQSNGVVGAKTANLLVRDGPITVTGTIAAGDLVRFSLKRLGLTDAGTNDTYVGNVQVVALIFSYTAIQ